MNRSLLRLAVCGLLAAGSMAVAGCSGDETKPQSPIQFQNPPAWTNKDVELDSVAGAALQGNAVVLTGSRDNLFRLVVADPKSGEARWSISEEQVLPGQDDAYLMDSGIYSPLLGATGSPVIAGDDQNWSVIVGYGEVDDDDDAVGTPERWGIAALSGTDGSLLWARPLLKADKGFEGSTDAVLPVGADEDTVMAMTRSGPRAYALDAGTGKQLWDREDVWPYAVSGEVVVGQQATEDENPPWEPANGGGGAAYGWDARSGKRLWTAKETNEDFRLQLATETAVVASDRDEGRIVDITSGEKLAETGGIGDCAVDVTTGKRFACSLVGSSSIAVVTVDDGEATVAENGVSKKAQQFSVTGMYDERIFVDADDGETDHRGTYLVDDEARILAKGVPGVLADMSGLFAVFLSGGDNYQGYDKAGLYEVVKS